MVQSNFKIRVWARSPYFAIESVSNTLFKVGRLSSIKTNVFIDSGFNNQIKYQLHKGPDWLRINSKTGKISGKPSIEDYSKDYVVRVRAADSNLLYSDYTFLIHVTRRNTPPRFLTLPNTVYYYDSLYQYKVKAVDDDTLFADEVVKYVLLRGPKWLSIDSSGLVTGVVDDTLEKNTK